jgi:hypothetical protein
MAGSGTVTADAEVVRHRAGHDPHRNSLIGNIVKRSTTRAFVIAGAAAMVGLISLAFLSERSAVPWILFGCAGWGGLDAALTRRRLAKGNYGDADYELQELVGPLVARIKKGSGPGDPDRLFPERTTEQPGMTAAEGQVAV